MNDIANRPDRTAAAAARTDEWSVVQRQAEIALESGFLPDSIKTAAQAITIAMVGRELGLPPMATFRLVSVVKGRPVVGAEAIAGLVLARIRGATLNVLESTDQRARVEAWRPGGTAARFEFTIADAQRAGLLAKDNWRHYPTDMLRWRATMRACRAVFPDVTLGIDLPDEADAAAPLPSAGAHVPPIARAAAASAHGSVGASFDSPEPEPLGLGTLVSVFERAIDDAGSDAAKRGAVASDIRGAKGQLTAEEHARLLARYKAARPPKATRPAAQDVAAAASAVSGDRQTEIQMREPGEDG